MLRQQVEKVMSEYNGAQESVATCKGIIEAFMGEVDQVEESAQVFENKKDDLEDQIRNLDWILESNVLRCESIERERSHMISEVAEKRERIGIIREDLADFFQQIVVT